MEKRILIRADDLGYSEGVNYGIAKSVTDGVIRSVGVMPNMSAAEQGLSLLRDVDCCLGQHTNVCLGRPLTDPSRIPSLVREDGTFKSSHDYRSSTEDFVVLDEAVLEVEAQYRRFVELTGQQPRYFEAHAVQSVNLYRALEIVAERYDLPHLDTKFNEPFRFRNTWLTLVLESMEPAYDPATSLKRAALRDYGEDGCAMFICHPGYLDAFVLKNSSLTMPRPMEVEMACSEEIKRFLSEHAIRVVTYDEL